MLEETLKHIDLFKLSPWSLVITMLLPPRSYVEIDIDYFFSVNVFKYNPLVFFGPKNDIFHKPEVSHKKSENWRFRFRYSFQTRLKGTKHTIWPILHPKKSGAKTEKKPLKHIVFLKSFHDAVINLQLRLDMY